MMVKKSWNTKWWVQFTGEIWTLNRVTPKCGEINSNTSLSVNEPV